jgi:DNA-binding YbaB/EbfC family protein
MKMMKQAQDLQAKAQKMQAELGSRHYTATSGGDAVTVVTTGDGNVVSVKIKPEIVKPEETEMLEDLLIMALRDSLEKGRVEMQKEMGKLTAGLGLPGLM